MGARRYVNPPGGRPIFTPQDWTDRVIELRFLEPQPLIYDCTPYELVENLSILDVLMWNDAEAVVDHIRNTVMLAD